MKPHIMQDCMSFAGPIGGDINSCLETDLSTCSAYIGEECQYVGERLGDIQEFFSSILINYYYFPQLVWSHLLVTCQAWPIVKSGGKMFSPLVQSSSTSLE